MTFKILLKYLKLSALGDKHKKVKASTLRTGEFYFTVKTQSSLRGWVDRGLHGLSAHLDFSPQDPLKCLSWPTCVSSLHSRASWLAGPDKPASSGFDGENVTQ